MKRLRKILSAAALISAVTLLFVILVMWKPSGSTPRGERLERIKQSPQWEKGKFKNELPEKMFFKLMLKRYWHGSPHASPAAPVPVEKVSRGRFGEPPKSGLRVTWFGHSSVLVEIDGHLILIDPVWGSHASPTTLLGPKRFHENPLPLEELPNPDAVIFSHDHYDHLDYPTIKKLKSWDTKFIMPLGMGAHFEYWGVAKEKIVETDWWDELKIKDMTLACLPARHFSGRAIVRNKTLWSGWALIGKKNRLYYSGDTAMFDGFKKIGEKYGPFNASLVEVGSYDPAWPDVHVGPEQAVEAHVQAKGGLFLPVHWSTFNLGTHGWTEPVERVLVAAEKAGVKVCVPKPGQSVEPASPPPVERWWPQLDWEKAEDAPVISTGFEKHRHAD